MLTARPCLRRTVPIAWLALALVGGGCGDDLAPVRDGLYLGSPVTFEVHQRAVQAVRLSGVECRVPHPDNPLLALCLERAPGLPGGSLPIGADGAFAGTLGEVALAGQIAGDGATGTWRFETVCASGEPCLSEGTWEATWRPAPVTPDAGASDTATNDAGPVDVGPASDPGDPGDAGPVPPDATTLQRAAHDRLGVLRGSLGMGPLGQTGPLNAAAQAHADYYARHAGKYAAAQLSPHAESPDWPEGFTGASLGARLAAQGVGLGAGVAEVMAFVATAEAAIDGWLETLYHRVPLVHPNAVEYGYGGVAQGTLVQVMDVVYGGIEAQAPARYPPPDATGVSPSWAGNEAPQPPLPPGESYPSGPVVTLSWPLERSASLSAAGLSAPDGAAVPVQVRSPDNDDLLRSTWALYALDPLAAGTRYTVRFEGTVDGAPVVETWGFTTR